MLFNERILLDIAREQQRARLKEAEAFHLARQLGGDAEVHPKVSHRLAGRIGDLLIAAGTRLQARQAENLQVGPACRR